MAGTVTDGHALDLRGIITINNLTGKLLEFNNAVYNKVLMKLKGMTSDKLSLQFR